MATKSILYYGDNLDVLRRHIQADSVDLVYLDPPFKSNQDYNILLKEKNGARSQSQIKAFADTWQWDEPASRAYEEVAEKGGHVSLAMQALRRYLGETDMLAYLAMMAPRLVELKRVLKETGSIFLHCDPSASHYLKMLMDSVFGGEMFVNEIVWRRSHTRSSISRRFRRAHDVILFYAKGPGYKFNMQYGVLSKASKELYSHPDERGSWQSVPLLVSGRRKGKTGEPWHGIDPNLRGKNGMHWVTTSDKLDEYDRQGLIIWPQKPGGTPRLKYYLDESPGVPAADFWDDIPIIASSSSEALGYPTQKPQALLERIIQAGSDEGDVVLDPFCGCGTTVAAAQHLNRRWIGIDITNIAITLIRHRLHETFGEKLPYEVLGEPVSPADAQALARSDPYQFQWWALGLVDARPADAQRGADRGIDGRLFFHDEREGGKTKQIILQVKAGHVTPAQVRDLRGVMEREAAEIAVLITMEEPSSAMQVEAASAGFYRSPWGKKHPRLQILTIAELLAGKRIDFPPSRHVNITFRKASKLRAKGYNRCGRLFAEE